MELALDFGHQERWPAWILTPTKLNSHYKGLQELHKGHMPRFAVGIWTQRFRNLTGALLHAFGDVYAPSFEGIHIVI